MKPKGQKEEFVQEYLYIEDYYSYNMPPETSQKDSNASADSEKEERGVIIIDLLS